MNESEQNIYDGISYLSEELASFFRDGLRLEHDVTYETKGYLLAHIMREIDKGLRMLLTNSYKKSKLKEELNQDDKIALNFQIINQNKLSHLEYVEEDIERRFIKSKDHIADVSIAFGFPLTHPISIEYSRIVIYLHSYAHGKYKELRRQNDELILWRDYIAVLELLFGSQLRIKDRLDTILSHDQPSKENINGMRFLLRNSENYHYFFSSLKKRSWFNPLFEEGYFLPLKNHIYKSRSLKDFYSENYKSIEYICETVLNTDKEINDNVYTKIVEIINQNINHLTSISVGEWDVFYNKNLYKLICHLKADDFEERHLTFVFRAIDKVEFNFIASEFSGIVRLVLAAECGDILMSTLKYVFKSKEINHGIIIEYDSYHTDYVFSELIRNIPDEFYNKNIENSVEYLKGVVKKMHDECNWTFDNEQLLQNKGKYIYDNEGFKYKLLETIYKYCMSMEISSLKKVTNDLIKNSYRPFQLVGIHLISNRFIELKDLLFSSSFNPLNYVNCHLELYHCISINSKLLNSNEVKTYYKWIFEYEVPYNTNYFIEKQSEIDSYMEFQRLRWLLAIENNTISKLEILEIKKIKAKYLDKTILPPGEIEWDIEINRGGYHGFSNTEMEGKTINEITDLWNNHVVKNPKHFSNSNFHEVLKDHIAHNIQNYCLEQLPEYNTPIIILNAWINGVDKAWINKEKSFNTEVILGFCNEICSDQSFLSKLNETSFQHIEFIKGLYEFIGHGLDDDKHCFNKESLIIIKKLLIHLSKFEFGDENRKMEMSVLVYNSTFSICFIKMYSYNLHLARRSGIKRWDTDILDVIKNKLQSNSERRNLLAYIIGLYYPQSFYLNEKIAFDLIQGLFSSSEVLIWKSVIEGYLNNNRYPIKRLHEFLIKEGHIYRSLSSNLVDVRYKTIAVDQILIGFVNYGHIGIHDEIKMILESEEEKLWLRLEYFLWDPKNLLPSNIEESVLHCINETYNYIKANNEKNVDCLKRGILKWIGKLGSLNDEVCKIAKKITVNADYRHGNAIIEQLSKHLELNPVSVGEILVELVKKDLFLYGEVDKLESILKHLYSIQEVNLANKIIQNYSKNNHISFRDLYRANNLPK